MPHPFGLIERVGYRRLATVFFDPRHNVGSPSPRSYPVPMPSRLAVLVILTITTPAHAVILRGKVTTPLGKPIPGARIQLIQGPRSVADTISGLDGTYEIRTELAGRFFTLTAAGILAPGSSLQISEPFYAGRTDLLTRNIALEPSALVSEASTQQTLREIPLAQLPTPTTQFSADQLLTSATLIPTLSATPGAFLLELGQQGSPANLYLRGASPRATKVVIAEVSAEDLGGGFNFAALSGSGLSAIASTQSLEITAGPLPLRLLNAKSGLVSAQSVSARTLTHSLVYSGDAGNLGVLRNEAVLAATHIRADAIATFARFDLAGESSPTHLITASSNLGYHISANTSLRAILRREVLAAPIPSPIAIFGISPASRHAEQNLFASATLETRTPGDWHNLLRVGLARKRAEDFAYATPATGLPVTLTAPDGTSVTGVPVFPQRAPREDRVTNRDEYTYQTDSPILSRKFANQFVVFTARYQQTHAADLIPTVSPVVAAARTTLTRNHFATALAFQGDIRHRVHYATSGTLDYGPSTGLSGSPQLGLTWTPVVPGSRRFRGTAFHASAGTGAREPGFNETGLNETVNARARTAELALDQTILPRKLLFHTLYFHNQFSHESEQRDTFTSTQTLAFRTQGVESSLLYTPKPRLQFSATYTYLASLVESTAIMSRNAPNSPPNAPQNPGKIPIGVYSALLGARPFHRPPHSGAISATYVGTKLSASFQTTFASRSDDSTFQPTLLLPNRDLAPSQLNLSASITYALTRRILAFTELQNLTNSRQNAPFGYHSTPFLVRSGLRIRLGGD